METVSAWTADDWAALWTGCGVAVTAIAAILALVQLRTYTRESLDRARPFVIVDFVFVGDLLQFHIWNSSPSAASRVRIKSDKPIRSSDDSGFRNAGLEELLAGRVIPHLPPGRMIAWTFDMSVHAFHPEVLDDYLVTVTYEDPRLKRRRAAWRLWEPKVPVEYSEEYALSIRHYNEASVPRDDATRIVEVLREIRTAVQPKRPSFRVPRSDGLQGTAEGIKLDAELSAREREASVEAPGLND
ncbi:hypothetical protein J7E25_11860 [Agromyces sp. ISL-38]|uniref:hypothetical protein n=1 Tax=Agromyces sp. ISL-38 TaxID=2819107 RepID=UPI001BECA9EF|nr:hypothetical protein [Agromyces sp. ISL-38]MBT2499790.1 hypothetical protein [Agromyces sp. ISL-38]